MSAPAPPFTRLSFRWAARIGRFLPCTDKDPRGSMVETLDATGHVVIAITGGNGISGRLRIIGYEMGEDSEMYDPADGLKWLSTKPTRRTK